nr:hypothetical protein Itr_chr07CG11540 [Ipomoea trifida]
MQIKKTKERARVVRAVAPEKFPRNCQNSSYLRTPTGVPPTTTAPQINSPNRALDKEIDSFPFRIRPLLIIDSTV